MIQRCAIAILVTCSGALAQDWPSFRGPDGDGVSTSVSAPLKWDRKTNIKWQVAMPRPANGSPIVSEGRVFVTSAEDDKGTRRSLYCFDRENGKELWARTVRSPMMPTHKTNPYCGTTPVADGKHVVVWHGSAGLFCYDFAGKELWHREFGQFKHRWGYGTSPILHDDHVILHSGPGAEVFVAALRLSDGKTVWRHDEPVDGDGQDNAEKRFMGSWSTPIITTVDGKAQIICPLATRIVAFDPVTGKIVWWCEGVRSKRGDLAYQSPSIADGILTFISGYSGPGMAVRLDAQCRGNISKTHRLWLHKIHNQCIGSGVIVDGSLFSPGGDGDLVCLDPATGDTRWKQRMPRGELWGSMVLVAGRVYMTNQLGSTIVFKPSAEKFELLATNPLGETCNSTPAVSDEEIFIRTFASLYCIAEVAK